MIRVATHENVTLIIVQTKLSDSQNPLYQKLTQKAITNARNKRIPHPATTPACELSHRRKYSYVYVFLMCSELIGEFSICFDI